MQWRGAASGLVRMRVDRGRAPAWPPRERDGQANRQLWQQLRQQDEQAVRQLLQQLEQFAQQGKLRAK